MPYTVAPSILSADFARLGEEINAVANAGADWIHVDVMDGRYVPNITIGPPVIRAVDRVTDLPLDVHLMIEDPDRFIPEFAEAGADYIAVHAEAARHLHRTLTRIRECGARPAVALNPSTPLSAVEWVLEEVAFVLLMTVNPGFGGQDFIPSGLKKIARLREMIETRGLSTRIQVDGGIAETTIGEVAKAGADIFVAGSAVFKSGDYAGTIRRFHDILDAI
jgi:ribulose-phosphate 3-epimerase